MAGSVAIADDAALSIILGSLPDQAREFGRVLFGGLAAGDLAFAPPAAVAALAQEVWSLGDFRPAETSLVRARRTELGIGIGGGRVLVELINDDMPFLVDSATACLGRHRLSVDLVIHPVVLVQRDETGQRTGFGNGRPESVIVVLTSGLASDEQLAALEEDLVLTFSDVRTAVADWRTMLARLDETVAGLRDKHAVDGVEVRDFLRWLGSDNFTFLGYREYELSDGKIDVVPNSGLGILRDPATPVFEVRRNITSGQSDLRGVLERPEPLLVAKSNGTSRVHRPVPMDVIGVKRFDGNGKVIGERRFIGLFTSTAYSQSARLIPQLRRKISTIIDRAGLNPSGHDGKALAQILETYPRDELFSISVDELYEVSLGILRLQERRRVALFVRRDPFERFVSCLVFVPQERYGFALRQRLQAILASAFGGEVTAATAQIYDSPLARLHIIIRTTPGAVLEVDQGALEAQLAEEARSWDERLLDATEHHAPECAAVARRLLGAFPTAYTETVSPRRAVGDIRRLAHATQDLPALHLYRRGEGSDGALALKIYRPGGPVALSDVLPILENLGFRALTEEAFELRPTSGDRVWIHDFELSAVGGAEIDVDDSEARLADGFLAVWSGRAEDDAFNRLILRAGLTWREAVIWRAYSRYLRQIGFTFSHDYIARTLDKHQGVTRLLTRLFHARFDPHGASETAARGLMVEIEHALDQVSVLDEDRILRRLINLVMSTLRTNYYQLDADRAVKSYVSFKLDSQAIEDLPKPRPLIEIWVYSPAVEAIHLRGGKVARGGIRWSDRREDFRTEILGLIKAQMVKNAVIVPVGSKGGFVVKRLPPPEAGRPAQQAEVIACYKTLMRGMLDLTDNRVGRAIVPPTDVVRHDPDDPYLVVAADKGTATFSDIANGVARDYGFWLDDAFASGGSVGYDHKKMGITARGAWVAVERHFREMGLDPNRDPITVVGVGDMSGDVFGNGLLRSSSVKLLAAFDHRHIFLDPSPDPKRSFAERQRMFNLPGSSWNDYDKSLISPGGGVFERSAKSVQVSAEVRAMLDLDRESLAPAELMRAILKSTADLIWFGGIGTYVKATTESQADAGDRANDSIRINGTEVRAKVVGEGANLGFTQKGRIEYSAQGGRINTDAIDNSAGVDTSDHEVNIKILFAEPIAEGKLDVPGRDTLLAGMSDEVAQLVLRDNYLQTFALSAAEREGPAIIDPAERLMEKLEREVGLDREIETLPSSASMAERTAAGLGLWRPELAVLIAYAKIAFYNTLLPSDVPDDAALHRDLVEYFPVPLRERFASAIDGHGLKREIIATVLTNEIINRGGPTFVSELERATGAGVPAIARGFVTFRRLFDLDWVWSGIEALDFKVDAQVQLDLLRSVADVLTVAISWSAHRASHGTINEAVESLQGDIDALIGALPPLDASATSLPGVPEKLVGRIMVLRQVVSDLGIIDVAHASDIPVARAASAYFRAGERFGIAALRRLAMAVPVSDAWSREAVLGLAEALDEHQQALAVILNRDDSFGADRSVPGFVRLDRLLSELQASPTADLARLVVAERALREVRGGS